MWLSKASKKILLLEFIQLNEYYYVRFEVFTAIKSQFQWVNMPKSNQMEKKEMDIIKMELEKIV
jgi:hypothetical protein